MKTFLILFALIFIPFLWYIVNMLRYTTKTIGDESPLYSEQSYHISASEYFCRFYKLLLAFCLTQMLLIVWLMSKEAIRQNSPLLFIFVLTFAAIAVYLCFIFYFDWQYWTITRNVSITLNPHQPSITVRSPGQFSFLSPSNVIRIEHHLRKTENIKDPLGGYGFFLFYDTTGKVTQLNNIFLVHVEFLQRFFNSVPSSTVLHTYPYPWIDESGNEKDPV